MALHMLSIELWAQNKSPNGNTSDELPTDYIPIIGEVPKFYDLSESDQVVEFGRKYGTGQAVTAKEGKASSVSVKSESSLISKASKAALHLFIKGVRNDICGTLEIGENFKVVLGFDVGSHISIRKYRRDRKL